VPITRYALDARQRRRQIRRKRGVLRLKRVLAVEQQDAKHPLHGERTMADNDAALKMTQTWARAATVTSSHERDHFVE
jgi:hypothetical protein